MNCWLIYKPLECDLFILRAENWGNDNCNNSLLKELGNTWNIMKTSLLITDNESLAECSKLCHTKHIASDFVLIKNINRIYENEGQKGFGVEFVLFVLFDS